MIRSAIDPRQIIHMYKIVWCRLQPPGRACIDHYCFAPHVHAFGEVVKKELRERLWWARLCLLHQFWMDVGLMLARCQHDVGWDAMSWLCAIGCKMNVFCNTCTCTTLIDRKFDDRTTYHLATALNCQSFLNWAAFQVHNLQSHLQRFPLFDILTPTSTKWKIKARARSFTVASLISNDTSTNEF